MLQMSEAQLIVPSKLPFTHAKVYDNVEESPPQV